MGYQMTCRVGGFRRRKPMSTHSTDQNDVQETPSRRDQSIFTKNTVLQEKVSSPTRFSPPPRRPPHSRKWSWFVIAAVSIAVVLIFSLFAFVFSQQRPSSGNQM